MRSIIIPAVVVAAIAAAPQFALADSHRKSSDALTSEQVLDRVFTQIERRILKRYYEEHGQPQRGHSGGGKKKGLPPGLAKRGGNLPPGLAKRGGTLPPGLAKRLPDDLVRELPARPAQYERVIVDNDVVLIDAVTNKVLDILEDVIRR